MQHLAERVAAPGEHAAAAARVEDGHGRSAGRRVRLFVVAVGGLGALLMRRRRVGEAQRDRQVAVDLAELDARLHGGLRRGWHPDRALDDLDMAAQLRQRDLEEGLRVLGWHLDAALPKQLQDGRERRIGADHGVLATQVEPRHRARQHDDIARAARVMTLQPRAHPKAAVGRVLDDHGDAARRCLDVRVLAVDAQGIWRRVDKEPQEDVDEPGLDGPHPQVVAVHQAEHRHEVVAVLARVVAGPVAMAPHRRGLPTDDGAMGAAAAVALRALPPDDLHLGRLAAIGQRQVVADPPLARPCGVVAVAARQEHPPPRGRGDLPRLAVLPTAGERLAGCDGRGDHARVHGVVSAGRLPLLEDRALVVVVDKQGDIERSVVALGLDDDVKAVAIPGVAAGKPRDGARAIQRDAVPPVAATDAVLQQAQVQTHVVRRSLVRRRCGAGTGWGGGGGSGAGRGRGRWGA